MTGIKRGLRIGNSVPKRGLVALLLAASVLLPLIAAAVAGAQNPAARFVYELCDNEIPGGSPPTSTSYAGSAAFGPFENCALKGGSVGVFAKTASGASAGAITFPVGATPGGYVESDTYTAGTRNLQPGNVAFVGVEGSPPADEREHTRTQVFRTAAPPCPECDAGGGIEIFLGCREGTECQPNASVGLHYLVATEVDPAPPSINTVEGSLLSGTTVRGHQLLSASASDVSGGLSDIEVLIDGTVAPGAIAGSCSTSTVSNPSYEGVVASSPSPCPPELKGTWDLDTTEQPFREGPNSVQVCASDFATVGAPNTTCSTPLTVVVDDSCTESSVGGGEALAAAFVGNGRETATVPAETATEIGGVLSGRSGAPVAGATVCVQTQIAGSAGPPQTVASATTDSSGHFTYVLPAGPDRQVVVGYRHDAFEVTRSLSIAAPVRPSITLDRGRVRHGGTVAIGGALPGPDPAGRVVVLQASALHGKRWLTFRRATTGAQGRYRATYRFGGTSGTTTYRIRALVPRQTGYPWEPGHSVPRRIKVFTKGRRDGRDSGRHRGRKRSGGAKPPTSAGPKKGSKR